MSVKNVTDPLIAGSDDQPDAQTLIGEIEAVAYATGADAGRIRGQKWDLLQVLPGRRSRPEKRPAPFDIGTICQDSRHRGLAAACPPFG